MPDDRPPPPEPALDGASVLRLDPAIHAIPYGDDELFVRRGSRSVYSRVIRDDSRARVLSPLVGALSEPASLGDLRARHPGREEQVDAALELLEREGVVQRVTDRAARSADDRPVHILGDGQIARILADALTIPVATTLQTHSSVSSNGAHGTDLLDLELDEHVGEDGRLVVVAIDHLRPALSHAVNVWAADVRRPWLNVTTDGTELLVGPIVVPGRTACFNCFEIQDEATRQHRDHFLVYKERLELDGRRPETSTAAAYLAASWAALAVTQFEESGSSFLVERLLRIDLDRMDVVSQRVYALPRCPVCSRVRHDLRHTFL